MLQGREGLGTRNGDRPNYEWDFFNCISNPDLLLHRMVAWQASLMSVRRDKHRRSIVHCLESFRTFLWLPMFLSEQTAEHHPNRLQCTVGVARLICYLPEGEEGAAHTP